MADMLIQPARLASLLGTIDEAKATTIIEAVTAAIQGAVKQRLVAVTDDEVTGLRGTLECEFDLPERPVTAVTSVHLDGDEVTDYRRFGAQLWRHCGWETCPGEPSSVDVVYSHGYADDDPRLGPAQAAALMLTATIYKNPSGATSQSIGDYSVAYDAAVAQLSEDSPLAKSLRRRYGRRAGHVRQGA